MWSQRLEQHGFKRYCCDDMIESKLASELQSQGFSGIADVARWMGHPYHEQYPSTSAVYLSLERQSLEEIITTLSEPALSSTNIVIDTTGSVIYTGEDLLMQLQKLTTIVYLETPSQVQQQMMRSFFRNPKPLIWGDSFSTEDGENSDAALRRCYPLLLEKRSAMYQKYAHITLNYHTIRHATYTVQHFLDSVSTL